MPPSDALLYVSPERVFYRGPLGRPKTRTLGALAWYLSLEASLSVQEPEGGTWGGDQAVCVPAGVPHQVSTEGGHVICFLLELDFCQMPQPQAVAPVALPMGAATVGRLAALGIADLHAWRASALSPDAELDRLILGRSMPRRSPDPRIADVMRRIRVDPALAWQAADAAAHCGLSASRFMHIFKAEVGVGWRAFRAWKRARGLLNCVHSGENLTQLALTLGYPDATHFSHAIRHVTGLRPSDIISGSRQLGVWSEIGVSPGAAS
jgi:AraC-like DNA-binding protein